MRRRQLRPGGGGDVDAVRPVPGRLGSGRRPDGGGPQPNEAAGHVEALDEHGAALSPRHPRAGPGAHGERRLLSGRGWTGEGVVRRGRLRPVGAEVGGVALQGDAATARPREEREEVALAVGRHAGHRAAGHRGARVWCGEPAACVDVGEERVAGRGRGGHREDQVGSPAAVGLEQHRDGRRSGAAQRGHCGVGAGDDGPEHGGPARAAARDGHRAACFPGHDDVAAPARGRQPVGEPLDAAGEHGRLRRRRPAGRVEVGGHDGGGAVAGLRGPDGGCAVAGHEARRRGHGLGPQGREAAGRRRPGRRQHRQQDTGDDGAETSCGHGSTPSVELPGRSYPSGALSSPTPDCFVIQRSPRSSASRHEP